MRRTSLTQLRLPWRLLTTTTAAACGSCCRRLASSASSTSSSSSSQSSSASSSPRAPARVRSDSAPLYEQMRRERRSATERAAVDKMRADMRRRQFDSVSDAPTPLLQAARHKPVELPANCLPWQNYALFADPPELKPLKSPDGAEDCGSFAGMLRRSAFVGLGDFENRVVCGRIFERFEGNLYVDFGGKFHAVCPAPRVNSEKYVRGAQVMLRLLDPEMTSKFLGSERHVTLAEADAVLLGLLSADADDADTVSPLKLALTQLVLDEEAAAATAAAYSGGVGDGGGGGGDAGLDEADFFGYNNGQGGNSTTV